MQERKMFALSDAELGMVGKAFDRAWDSFLRTGRLTVSVGHRDLYAPGAG